MATENDQALRLLGADILLGHLTSLQVQLPGVIQNDDIECLHKTRVASRRIRAALRLFGKQFGKRSRDWTQAIRRITRALSPARDLDVQLEFLNEFKAQLKRAGQRPGHARLTLRLKQERQAMQAKVAKEAKRLLHSATLADMTIRTQEVRVQAELSGLQARSPAINLLASKRVSSLLQAALLFEPFICRPECVQQLHNMRIAFKRLRYTLEAFGPAYDGRLNEFIQQSKSIQTLLGDIHDCDVWLEILPLFLEQERQKTIDYFGHARPFRRFGPGISAILEDRQAQRAALYERFRNHWRLLREQEIWAAMLTALSTPDPIPGEPA